MLLIDLMDKGLIHPPKFVAGFTKYLVTTGSFSYGMSNSGSDVDIAGFCIPPKKVVFPHLDGEIQGFGTQVKRFEQWQKHHVIDEAAKKEYDFTIFSIIKFFKLVMEGNPNMVDILFVPPRCVRHTSDVSERVRLHRDLFLNKTMFHKFKGYAYSQHKKIRDKSPQGKRLEMVQKYGYDVKAAAHLVRLLGEIEQILVEGTLVLDEEGRRESLKSIRRGDWDIEKIDDYFFSKEAHLEKLYHTSDLRQAPDEARIKNLLLECLDMAYCGIEDCVLIEDEATKAIRDIQAIIEGVSL